MTTQQQNPTLSHQHDFAGPRHKAGNLALRPPYAGKVITEGGAHMSNYTEAGSRPPISDGE